MPGRVLGIDFGSSSTAAVLRWPDGRVRPLLFDGSPLLSSAVYADPQAGLLTGRDAQHAARLHPDRYEPNPKRRIDEGSLLLGDQTYPVAGLIAAVLRRVADEGVRAGGGPIDELVLTYPVAWGGPRRELLLRAAALAQLPEPRLVPEPVAAAGYFVSVLGQALPVGAGVLVYDLGAGTFDATAVRRTPRGFEVLASTGIPDAGGLDIDAAILKYLHGAYPDHDFDAIRGRDRLLFWDNIRGAKESLSRVAGTAVPVPVLDIDAPLGRETLDGIAAPVIGRTIAAAQSAMRAFGTPGAPVFLVGGASRMPAVALHLHRTFGAPPVVIELPELVVAEGSLFAVLATPDAQATAATALVPPAGPGYPSGAYPVTGAPLYGPPVSGPPVSGPPVSGPPVSGLPISGPPVSGLPIFGAPSGGVPAGYPGGGGATGAIGTPIGAGPVGGFPSAAYPVTGVPVSGSPVSAGPGGGGPGGSGPGGGGPGGGGPGGGGPGGGYPVSGPVGLVPPAGVALPGGLGVGIAGTVPGQPGQPALAGQPGVPGGSAWTGRPPVAAAPPNRFGLPVAVGGGLLAALLLAPALVRDDGQRAFGTGLHAPVTPTGLVASLILVLLVGLTRPAGLRLGPPPLPRPSVVLTLAGWVTGGLMGTLTLLAALLRAGASWQDLTLTGDPSAADTALGSLRGVGRVLLIVALAVAVGLVVGALVLITRRTRDDPLAQRGRRLAGTGLVAGGLLALTLATHLFDLGDIPDSLDRDDPVLYLANRVFGGAGVLDAIQHWGLFAVAGFAVVTALLFTTVAVRVAVEGVPRRVGNFATGTGYGLCAALAAYLIVHAWYELRYWPAAGDAHPPEAPAILRAGHALWGAGWLFLLAFVVLGLVGTGQAVARAGSAARTVRRFRGLR